MSHKQSKYLEEIWRRGNLSFAQKSIPHYLYLVYSISFLAYPHSSKRVLPSDTISAARSLVPIFIEYHMIINTTLIKILLQDSMDVFSHNILYNKSGIRRRIRFFLYFDTVDWRGGHCSSLCGF